jgi:hemoglobin-like flavoprotein
MAEQATDIVRQIGQLKNEIIKYLNQGNEPDAKEAAKRVQAVESAAKNLDSLTSVINIYNEAAKKLSEVHVVRLDDLFSADGVLSVIMDTLYDAATMDVDKSLLDFFNKKQETEVWEAYQKQMFDNGSGPQESPAGPGPWKIVKEAAVRPKLGNSEWGDLMLGLSGAVTGLAMLGDIISKYINIFATETQTSEEKIRDWATGVKDVSKAMTLPKIIKSMAILLRTCITYNHL